jgi:AraC family transcriptional regulator, regulatory protein of adaptative response / methylphosphotriester-DNA alkyltransferase methyltransferase
MAHRPITIATRTSVLQDAQALIDAELGTDLEVEDVARRIATSRRQLQRCFRELADTTFRDYVARRRMERAAELLVQTPLTVRQIAAQVGYRQPAQFAKAFRRVHGTSPATFRAERSLRAAHAAPEVRVWTASALAA